MHATLLFTLRCSMLYAIFCEMLLYSATGFGANVSIRKDIKIQAGPQTTIFADTNWFADSIYPLRDGGYLVSAGTFFERQVLLIKLDHGGHGIWTNEFDLEYLSGFRSLQERREGGFIAIINSTRIVVLSEDGYVTNGVSAPGCFGQITQYSQGYLFAGFTCNTTDPPYIRKLSKNFVLDPHFVIPFTNVDLGQFAALSDGGLIVAYRRRDCGTTLAKVDANGTFLWQSTLPLSCVAFVTSPEVHVCPDGGCMLCATVVSPSGIENSASFGGNDFWLMKWDAKGNQIWQRTYGGAGNDAYRAICDSEDGGFLLCGETHGSGVSGNKTVDGDGLWLLKLDSNGLKQSEAVLPGQFQAFAQRSGYVLVGNPPSGLPFSNWAMKLLIDKRVHVAIMNASQTPYSLDVSTDLSTWNPFVVGALADLDFSEPIQMGRRFYRLRQAQN